jgi:hypothetical protein
MQKQNVALMAECAHNLAHFDAQEAAVQGYIATLPLFCAPNTKPRAPLGPPAEAMQAMVESLAELFQNLLSVIRDQLKVRF